MTRRTVAVLALALPLLAACGAGGSTDAASSGTGSASLVVYSGRSEALVGPLIEAFEQATGVDAEVRYGSTAELAAQLVEEGDRSPAEVFFAQDAGALGTVANAGLLAPLPTTAVSAVAAQYRSADGTWTGVTGRARVIAYDGESVPRNAVPTSVLDLTAPEYKGKVGIAPTNASFQSFITAMRLEFGEAKTEAWLRGMVGNDVQKYEQNGLILDAVNQGQISFGLINHYYWFEKAATEGAEKMRARIAFTEPGDPGSLVNVAGAGVLKTGASDPGAARFVEYLLSADAQTYFRDKTFEYPLAADVTAVAALPPLSDLKGPDIPLADLSSLPQTLELLRDVGLV